MNPKEPLVIAAISGAAPGVQAKDIVDTAVGTGNSRTLAASLRAADLVSTLEGSGPFRAFAPTHAAFVKIPRAELDALLEDMGKPRAGLACHVVKGKVVASDQRAGNVATVHGGNAIVGTAAGATISGADVVVADVHGAEAEASLSALAPPPEA